MKQTISRIKNARLRKLPVMAAFVAVLLAPTALQAFASPEVPEEQDQLVVGNINQDGDLAVEEPTTPIEEPVQEPTPEPTEPVLDPTDDTATEEVEDTEELPEDNGEDEVPAPVDPVADVTRFMEFANAEHPGVEVESYAFVYKRGVKAFKVTYVDGYTVFIATGDFSTLKVVDGDKKVKKCQKRVMSARKFYHWYWKFTTYQEFWNSYQNDPEGTVEGIEIEDEDDDSEDESQEQVQPAAASERRSPWSTKYNKSDNRERRNR